jgi:hypothetical protein
MIFLVLTICHTVFAQGMDSSYCLISTSMPLKKTGGNPVNTCDPQRVQNMITGRNENILLQHFTNQGEYVHTVIWGKDSTIKGEKIRVSARSYRREKNLIYDTDMFGCTYILRITEDTATHLSLKAEALRGQCDKEREFFELKKNDSPYRYRKIKY